MGVADRMNDIDTFVVFIVMVAASFIGCWLAILLYDFIESFHDGWLE